MINNRQQNGRRRGRGGPQVRNGGPGNGADRGNRIDNRARGNAAQLHEKYRNLARDAQTQGDRVMTEYYLQFADHYFRVLGESRARFDEQGQGQGQNQQRRPQSNADDFDDNGFDGDGDDGIEPTDQRRFDREVPRRDVRETAYEDGESQPRRDNREARDNREPRDNRDAREPREARDVREARPRREETRPPRDNRDQRPPRDRDYAPREAAQQDVAPAPAAPVQQQPAQAAPSEPGEGEVRRPRRGRPPRSDNGAPRDASGGAQNDDGPAAQIEIDRLPPAFAPTEPVTTRRKAKVVPVEPAANAEPEAPAAEGEAAPRRRRVRRTGTEDSNVAA